MVVVVIIGVLVAIAVPIYQSVTNNAEQNAIDANVRIIDGAIGMWSVENSATDTERAAVTKGQIEPYVQVWPTGPKGTEYTVVNGKAVATTPTP
jgi:type IV pilus assembly protein PilA